MRVGTKRSEEEREKRQREMKIRRGSLRKGEMLEFSSFSIHFPKVILHISYCFGIHKLWLTLTNNSLSLGFHWMKMQMQSHVSTPRNSNIIFLLLCDLHSSTPLTSLMALFSYSLKCLLSYITCVFTCHCLRA